MGDLGQGKGWSGRDLGEILGEFEFSSLVVYLGHVGHLCQKSTIETVFIVAGEGIQPLRGV